VIVVTDHTTKSHVAPIPSEKMEAASYLTSTPSGLPEILVNSNNAGRPKAQIMMIETGTIVVVKKSTAVNQFRSSGYSPDLANLYICIDSIGIIVTIERRMTTLHLIWIHAKGPYTEIFSLFGPVCRGI
jgi:hypothetical protein